MHVRQLTKIYLSKLLMLTTSCLTQKFDSSMISFDLKVPSKPKPIIKVQTPNSMLLLEMNQRKPTMQKLVGLLKNNNIFMKIKEAPTKKVRKNTPRTISKNIIQICNIQAKGQAQSHSSTFS